MKGIFSPSFFIYNTLIFCLHEGIFLYNAIFCRSRTIVLQYELKSDTMKTPSNPAMEWRAKNPSLMHILPFNPLQYEQTEEIIRDGLCFKVLKDVINQEFLLCIKISKNEAIWHHISSHQEVMDLIEDLSSKNGTLYDELALSA